MREVLRADIPARGVKSLCWDGEELVDWVAGERRFYLDGTIAPRRVIYAYRFTQAILSPDRRYAVIFEKNGTKGLILRNGAIIREINRSFYHADAYDYPVCLFTLPNGETAIVHCPERCNELQIEEVESGQRLTVRGRSSTDFFHSRLQVSGNNKYMMSAGWIWHPADDVMIYDISQVLMQPEFLDEAINCRPANTEAEIRNAAFLDNDHVVFASGDAYDDADGKDILQPDQIGVYCLSSKSYKSIASLPEPTGQLMPVGDFAFGFYEHPRLIHLASGEVVAKWPELATGKQNSSIYREPVPPLALDAINKRFAVADDEKITVVQLA